MQTTDQIVTNNVYDFDQGDDVQFVKTVWRFMETNRVAEANISTRVHKMLLPFNNPANPVTAAAKAKSHLVDIVRRVKVEIKELDPASFGLKEKDGTFELTGNSAFANAAKAFLNCMENGGDLNTYVTQNSAKVFNQNTLKAKKEAERQGFLYKEQALLLKAQKEAKGEQVDENSQEFKHEVTRAVSALITTGSSAISANDEDLVIHDEWYTLAIELADAAREFVKISNNKAVAEQMLQGVLNRIKASSDDFLAANANKTMKSAS
jgi:hypothetical protein